MLVSAYLSKSCCLISELFFPKNFGKPCDLLQQLILTQPVSLDGFSHIILTLSMWVPWLRDGDWQGCWLDVGKTSWTIDFGVRPKVVKVKMKLHGFHAFTFPCL